MQNYRIVCEKPHDNEMVQHYLLSIGKQLWHGVETVGYFNMPLLFYDNQESHVLSYSGDINNVCPGYKTITAELFIEEIDRSRHDLRRE